jgi:hypothetical protein
VLHARGERRGAEWWWLASAFAVSWVADTLAHWANPWAIGIVYPIAQGVVVAAVLSSKERAAEILGVAVAVAVAVILTAGVDSPDILVRSVAWLPLVWIVARTPSLPARLRACIAVYFGLGWVTWLVHVKWLVVATWYPYQGARLVGLAMFCWATMAPRPKLALR